MICYSLLAWSMLFIHDPSASAPPVQPGTHVVKLKVGAKQRRYLIRVPPQFDGSKRLPVVVVFHGAGGTGRLYLDKNGWEKLADAEGFLAVAPDGQTPFPNQASNFRTNPQLWNDGSGRGRLALLGDESAFVAAMLADVESRFHADPHRIYLTGHSNGAGLCFLLAQKLGDRVAAIAPVMSHCWAAEPRLPRPVPTLCIFGMKDPLVPYEGGEAPNPWGGPAQHKPPVADTVRKWAGALGCAVEPRQRDSAVSRIEEYSDAQGTLLLQVVSLKRHGHGWPGGLASGLPEILIGPAPGDYNATQEIWAFFKSRSLR